MGERERRKLTLTVREVDVRTSRSDLLGLLERHFDDWRSGAESKFQWLYLDNPFGRARAWVLEDGSRGVLGLSAAFPRRLRTGAGTLEAWVLGDFCVDRALRSLGPALLLQRAICTAIDREECAAWYDFPSRTMLALYGRMGLPVAGEMVRLVHPLRMDAVVAKKIARPAVAKGVSVVGNVVLSTRDALRKRDPSVEVGPFAGAFTSSAAPCHGARAGVELERTPEYLDWRYRRDPRGASSVLAAWRDGTWGGSMAFRAHPDHHAIVDAFGVRGEDFLKELALAVIGLAREAGASRVTVGLESKHPWVSVFESVGFHARERVPYVVYTRPGVIETDAPWYLTSGDRDL